MIPVLSKSVTGWKQLIRPSQISSGDVLNYCYNDYLEFLFYTDDQTVRIGGGTFASLDENVELTNSYNYVKLPISLLSEGTKYLITFTATGDYTATVSVCPTESF